MSSRRVIIGKILPLESLEALVLPCEWVAAQEFASEKRRQEWLSWRAHLRMELSRESFCGVGDSVAISYNELGAPYLDDTYIYISVSHTRTHVGIVLSDKPCAIDIESMDRNFAGVRSRYLSPREQRVVAERLAEAWCAKEAAYKYSARRGVDLLRDIEILALDAGRVQLSIVGEQVTGDYRLESRDGELFVLCTLP